MLRNWAGAGFNPDQFWQQTPIQYVAIMDGVTERRRHEYNLVIEQAWRTANYMGMNKLPNLERELIGIENAENTKQATPDDGLAAWARTLKTINTNG